MPSAPQQPPRVTIAVPTLAGGGPLRDCMAALARQSFRDFAAVIVDNSAGAAVVDKTNQPGFVQVHAASRNLGYGAAVNLVWRASQSEFVAALNDDATPHPEWLAALMHDAAAHPKAGMWASRVRLNDRELDSAGLALYADGSSRQRGHRRSPAEYAGAGGALMPSGSAALYRRAMLEQTGGFDEDFFLYCEDTDLGLRAQWAGWTCRYVPGALVDHAYSQSAGRGSPLKAYYVERNRLRVALKNFPLRMLAGAPWFALRRYAWHALALWSGRGLAGEYRRGGGSALLLVWMMTRAHLSALGSLPALWSARRRIRRSAAVTPREFMDLVKRHSLTAREVALP